MRQRDGILKIEQCTTSEQALEVQTEQVQFEPLRLSRRDRNKKRRASERDVKGNCEREIVKRWIDSKVLTYFNIQLFLKSLILAQDERWRHA